MYIICKDNDTIVNIILGILSHIWKLASLYLSYVFYGILSVYHSVSAVSIDF